MTRIEIHHDPQRQRFTADLAGQEAYLQYRPAGEQRLDYVSTFVPPEHRRQGIGEALVVEALDWARGHDYAVIPSCPFIPRVLERHPEYQDLVARE